jgi:hypothetical protein
MRAEPLPESYCETSNTMGSANFYSTRSTLSTIYLLPLHAPILAPFTP